MTRSTKRGKKKKKKQSVVLANNSMNNSNHVNIERRNTTDMGLMTESITTALVSGTTDNIIQSIAACSSMTKTSGGLSAVSISGGIERQQQDILSSSSITSSSSQSSSVSSCLPISQVEIQVQLEGELHLLNNFCLM